MSASFTNQVLAQIELWTKGKDYAPGVYILPKHLDEKVARLHLKKIGVKLTELRPDQADYIGVDARRPVQVGALPLLNRPPRQTPRADTARGMPRQRSTP